MKNLTDKAWNSLREGETVFEVGTCIFNGCRITITDRTEPYRYVTRTGRTATKSARYWGVIHFPDGHEKCFNKKRGGEVARETVFFVEDEQGIYAKEGESYKLPYHR